MTVFRGLGYQPWLVAVLAFALSPWALAQSAPRAASQGKRPIQHEDYEAWTSIRSTAWSPDGSWMAYLVSPAWGDGVLHVRHVDSDKVFTVERGSSPAFSVDGRYLIYSVGKSVVEERQKQLKELYSEEESTSQRGGGAGSAASGGAGGRPTGRTGRRTRGFGRGRGGGGGAGGVSGGGADTELFVMTLTNGESEALGKTRSFRVDGEGRYLVYHEPKPEEPKPDDKAKADETSEGEAGPAAGGEGQAPAAGGGRQRGQGGAQAGRRSGGRGTGSRGRGARGAGRGTARGGRPGGATETPDEGTALVIRDLASDTTSRVEAVKSFSSIVDGEWLAVVRAKSEANKSAAGLDAVHLEDLNMVRLVDGDATYSGFTTDRDHKRLAFTSNAWDKRLADAKAADEKAAAEKEAKEVAEKKAAAAGEAKEAEVAEEPASEPTAAGPERRGRRRPAPATGEEASTPASESDEDDADEALRTDVYLWDFSGESAQRAIHQDTEGVPAEMTVSGGLGFSDDGSVLTLGLRGPAAPDLPKILPDDKVTLDLWHYRDGQIQPRQAKSRGGNRPTLTTVFHIDDERLVVLGNDDVPTVRLITPDGSRALATDSKPYEWHVAHDTSYSDVHLVNTIDGSRKQVMTRLRGRPQTSPSGRWLLHFGQDNQWHAMDTNTQETHCLTSGLDVAFQNELEDRPQPASAYGLVGWTENERAVLLNDRWDIWMFPLEGGQPECVTDGYGRASQITLRYERFDLDGETLGVDFDRDHLPATILLSARDHATKAQGYFVDSTVKTQRPRKLVMMDRSIGALTRAKTAKRLFFTVAGFDQFPDYWVSNFEFEAPRKLTDGCPIQREVRGGTAELVTWTSDDGLELQGYLVKPDGFDPTQKYPMMVYFYERNADNVHRYTAPSAGTSPNAAYYVSNGYLWFVPDIVYEVGYPGESAEKCIVTGVQHLIAQGFVDKDAIGMAGHSWGGYQTAHLVTRTNLFAAAESGAPVTNMFSAYGGIRYDSGRSRQFQYERTQSRIGGTPWQYPQRYWQNSPVFYADRVQTPVLILHNDQDGAVPWTNGIEFFMALRRLEKEAYLFNYNGEPHGLRRKANQRDWTRRMAEFFDHHLKGAPAPEWMNQGVPYAEREREKIPHAPSFIEARQLGLIEGTQAEVGVAEPVVEIPGGDRR